MLLKLLGDIGDRGDIGPGSGLGFGFGNIGSGVEGSAFMRDSLAGQQLYSDDALRYGMSSMLRWVLRQVARLSSGGLSRLLSSFMFGVPIVVESLMSGTVK